MGRTSGVAPTLSTLSLLRSEAALRWDTWDWDPLVSTGLFVTAVAWWWVTRRFPPRRVQFWYGWSALLILALAVVSPLDHGAEASFTLHMVQHLLLMMVVAPLLALGAPVGFLGWLRRQPALGPIIRTLWSPVPAFAFYHLALFLWHLPVLYGAAVRYEGIHLLQHVTFLLGGLAFWGVIVAPEPRLVQATIGQRVVMVLAANILGWVLSFILAISERPLYAVYLEGPGPWGLSALTDMRLGGAAMWVAGNLVSGIALMLLLITAMRREDISGREAAERP